MAAPVCRACGKKGYRSEFDAIGAAVHAAAARGVGLRIYRCPRGRGWHLTKKPAHWSKLTRRAA